MFGWLKTWRERRKLRKLIRTMGFTLRKRYGPEEFYTPGQVLKTCDVVDLDEEARANSVAMYVTPELADGILSKMNRSAGARELRKYLIARCFDGFSDGSGTRPEESNSHNPFMHPSAHESFSSGGDIFGGWESSSDSGSSADSGGSHHSN